MALPCVSMGTMLWILLRHLRPVRVSLSCLKDVKLQVQRQRQGVVPAPSLPGTQGDLGEFCRPSTL